MRYLIISGNIGAGKSTLTGRLSERLGWRAVFEPVSANPYLEDFYADMGRWAFHSQLSFLTERLSRYARMQRGDEVAVQDRSVYEDAEVFAVNLYEQGCINSRDYAVYRRLYELLCSFIQPPELLVYLRSTPQKLKERISRRGRSCEQHITESYLTGLNELYEKWIDSYQESSVLTIDTSVIDIVERPDDLERVVELIREAVRGKQEELFEEL